SHVQADVAAKAVGLNEIHSGEKASLAEEIRPGVVCLHFELVDAVRKRELFERCSTLGEKIEIEAAVRPIGEKDFDGMHAELADGFESGAVDFGGGRLFHPFWKVPDAKAFEGAGGFEVEMAWHAGNVARVGAGDGLQDEDGVFNGARHGAELVKGPTKRHRASARNAAIGGAKAGDATAHAGADDAAAGFAADGEADQPRSGGRAGAGAGAGSAFFEEPGIHGLAAKPDVVERERAKTELGKENRAGVVQALDDGGGLRGDAVAKRLRAISGRDSSGVEKVFAAPGDAMKGPAIFAGGDFSVGSLRLGESEIARESNDATEFRIKLLNAPEINAGEALRREFALLDPARKL